MIFWVGPQLAFTLTLRYLHAMKKYSINLGLCIAIGVVLGVIFDKLAWGIVLGLLFWVIYEGAAKRKRPDA